MYVHLMFAICILLYKLAHFDLDYENLPTGRNMNQRFTVNFNFNLVLYNYNLKIFID